MAKAKKNEREILEEWLDSNARYEFLIQEEQPLHKLRKAKAATEAVDKILRTAADDLHRIANQFRSMGIGDTTVDDCIAGEFYDLFHFHIPSPLKMRRKKNV